MRTIAVRVEIFMKVLLSDDLSTGHHFGGGDRWNDLLADLFND